MGHATRCIPIVKQLLVLENIEVIFAGEKSTLEILLSEFPMAKTFPLSGYKIKYYKYFSVSISIMLQIPKIIWAIVSEHFWLKKFINREGIDLVISDNRYGLFSKLVPTVFITHQVFISSPIFSKIINRLNHWFIKKYTQCWIPDFEGDFNLSGKLSHGKNLPNNCIYIDPVSRFLSSGNAILPVFDIAAIVSGPEGERTRFENYLIKLFDQTTRRIVFFRGVENNKTQLKHGNIHFYNNCSAEKMNKVLMQSKIVISRSGYTTVMDLYFLGKPAILFATIGQYEQEYLATYLFEKKQFYTTNSNNINLEAALVEMQNYKPTKKASRAICASLAIELLGASKK